MTNSNPSSNQPLSQDDQIRQLYYTVKQKREEVEAAEARPTWRTNCAFRFEADQNSKVYNLQTADKDTLLLIAGTLLYREEIYAKGVEALGVKSKFTWLGYSVEDWMTDLKLRMNKLELSTKKAELAKLEKKLNAILPESLRVQIELEEIMQSDIFQD